VKGVPDNVRVDTFVFSWHEPNRHHALCPLQATNGAVFEIHLILTKVVNCIKTKGVAIQIQTHDDGILVPNILK
jgi:hypothetical protein